MSPVRVGMAGSGFMGRSHAIAFALANTVFGLKQPFELHTLADIDDATAAKAAADLGFRHSTGDWQAMVTAPEIDLVSITTPNRLHKPMALAALDAGKPVYCEKPLAPDAADAFAMAAAAREAGQPTFVGFNYVRNPMVRLAAEIIASGEIGEVWTFRGVHAEDYMSDADAPWTWRLDPAGGAGVIADLGSHIISLARATVGEIDALMADLSTVVRERPDGAGGTRKVEVDDEARLLVRFESGARGSLEASWIATGRKMYLAFEISGSKGSIVVNLERMNEMRLFVKGGRSGRDGYVEIPAGPSHPDYAPFCPAPGHQLGFNDIKAIEVKDIHLALNGGPAFAPDFLEAARIQAVVDAALKSSAERRWVRPAELIPA